jgi:mannose-6-phosphate isomerase-like protein (cupin superfamily)
MTFNRLRPLLLVLAPTVFVACLAPIRAEVPARPPVNLIPEFAREMVVVSPGSLEYIAIPNMPACSTAAILHGNPRFGPASVLLKLASGCRVPWHWHTANETLVVISGQGTIAMKDGPPLKFVPGAYGYLPAHHAHQATCRRTCLLFNSADAAFDIHYVDDRGQEIPLEKAMAATPKPRRRKR